MRRTKRGVAGGEEYDLPTTCRTYYGDRLDADGKHLFRHQCQTEGGRERDCALHTPFRRAA